MQRLLNKNYTQSLYFAQWYQTLLHVNSYGIFAGLVIGKPLGISLFSYISIKLKLVKLPSGLRLTHVLGSGFLAGIGFTMSIFITLLAFDNEAIIQQSKVAVMVSSLIAGIIGFYILKSTLRGKPIVTS